jgi:PAS domain S-box-containing protein
MKWRPPHRKTGPVESLDIDLRALVDRIAPVTYVAASGPDWVILHISPQIEALLGYPLREWTARSGLWISLLHPDDRDWVLERDEAAHHTLEPWDEEYRMVTRDGRVIWVRDQATPVVEADGRLAFWQGVLSDITAAKLAAEAVRGSEERYRTLVEQVPAVVYLCTNDSLPEMLYVSPQVHALTGYSAEELPGPLISGDMVHPDDLPKVVETWAGGLRDEAAVDREFRIIGRDGRQTWVLDQNVPIRDESGVVRYRQGVMQEITDRKLWEESLRESEERYRALIEQVPAIVYISSNEARPRTLYVSPQVQRLLGFDPRDLIEDRDLWMNSVHPDDRDSFFEQWARSFQTGEPFEAEYRLIAPDDREMWVQDRTVLISDDHGQPLAWQGVVSDISVQKQAERQLQAAAAKYRALVENIPAVVYEVAPDGDGTTLYVSPQVERLLGYPREEWLQQPDIWMELLHTDDREQTLAAYDLHNETGEPWSREYRLIASDGRAVWFRDEATLARDANGHPLAWQGVRMDITPQKRAEEALRSAHDDLEQRVRDRTQELEDANELMMLEVLERRRAESALRDAEEKYRLLVERLPAVSYIWDLNPPNEPWIPYTSPQIEALLGYTVEEWNSTPEFWLECVHPEDYDRVLAETMRSEATGHPYSIEYRFIAKDGRVVWVVDEARMERRTRAGRPRTMQGLMVDITERKEAEERLRRAEARALMMAEHLPAITYLWNPEASAEDRSSGYYVSPQIEDILGYTPDEWTADPNVWSKCLHPDDREAIMALPFWGHLPGGQWSHEYRLIAKDGRVVWIRDSGRAVALEDDGRLPALNGIMIDITAEKHNEERVKVAEERYRTLVEQIPAITYIEALEGTDPARGRIVFVSPQVEEILGYPPEQLVADPAHMERLVHPDDIDLFRAAGRTAADGKPFSAEYRVISRDGREVWLQSQAVLVRDGDGRPRFWHGIALDITARKRAEEELRDIEAKFRAIMDRTTVDREG